MNKKILTWLLVILFTMFTVSCTKTTTPSSEAGSENPFVSTSETQIEAVEDETRPALFVGKDTTWSVKENEKELWNLTIKSVEEVEYEENGFQKIKIVYDFTNLDYTKDDEGLCLIPKSVIDSEERIAQEYDEGLIKMPFKIAKGVSMEGAEVYFGLYEQSSTVKIIFEHEGISGKVHQIIYKLPIENLSEYR